MDGKLDTILTVVTQLKPIVETHSQQIQDIADSPLGNKKFVAGMVAGMTAAINVSIWYIKSKF